MKTNRYRTIMISDITNDMVGKTIVVSGWVQNIRDHGGVLFLDLRDTSGVLQTVSNDDSMFKGLAKESVIRLEGTLRKRSEDTINEKFFKENVRDKYQSHEDGLTERGFITFIEDAYMSEDGEAKVRQWLNLLGYDSELYPLRSRCFMLTFHSDTPISVSVRDALNTDLNSKVNKLILKSLGEEIKKKKDISAIQYQSRNNNIVTVGCVNKGSVPYRVVTTFADNGNIIFSGKSNKVERIIQPGNYEFFLHFFGIVSEKGTDNVDFSLDYFPLN